MTLTILFIVLLAFCIFCLVFAWNALDKKEEVEQENRLLRSDPDMLNLHKRQRMLAIKKMAEVDNADRFA